MWNSLKRWLDGVVSHLGRFALRLVGRPRGRWVEGSHSESHHRFLQFLLPQSRRHYFLYLPRKYSATRPMPLVVMLHGCKQSAEEFAAGTRMNEIADQEGFLVLYPEQRRLANVHRCWNWFDSSAQRGDGEAALIAGLVREVIGSLAVDPTRVYVAGLSAGGAMTSILASCHGELFAACAVHSGLMYGAAESVSEATRAMKQGSRASAQATARQAMARKDFAFVPAMVIQGSDDAVVNPMNADQLAEQFLAMSSLAQGGGAAVVENAYSESAGGRYPSEVHDFRRGDLFALRKVLVHGLGHAWSGGRAELPFNDPKGPDATQMIWDFFASFQRGDAAETAAAIVARAM
jgi:poly(hydroxyalkanoate) depolymerase family esterase